MFSFLNKRKNQKALDKRIAERKHERAMKAYWAANTVNVEWTSAHQRGGL